MSPHIGRIARTHARVRVIMQKASEASGPAEILGFLHTLRALQSHAMENGLIFGIMISDKSSILERLCEPLLTTDVLASGFRPCFPVGKKGDTSLLIHRVSAAAFSQPLLDKVFLSEVECGRFLNNFRRL